MKQHSRFAIVLDFHAKQRADAHHHLDTFAEQNIKPNRGRGGGGVKRRNEGKTVVAAATLGDDTAGDMPTHGTTGTRAKGKE